MTPCGTEKTTSLKLVMSTDRCLLFKVSISVSNGFLLAQCQTMTLRCKSMTHLSNRVASKSNGTSLLRMRTSANTVSFPSRMGTILISLVLASPPTPFAHNGIDAMFAGMMTLLIPQRFRAVSIRTKLAAPQVGWPAPVSTSALPAGRFLVKGERSFVVVISAHNEVGTCGGFFFCCLRHLTFCLHHFAACVTAKLQKLNNNPT